MIIKSLQERETMPQIQSSVDLDLAVVLKAMEDRRQVMDSDDDSDADSTLSDILRSNSRQKPDKTIKDKISYKHVTPTRY